MHPWWITLAVFFAAAFWNGWRAHRRERKSAWNSQLTRIRTGRPAND